MNEITVREWGHWEVLSEGVNPTNNYSFKVKKLTIKPKCSISHQYHNYRTESWFVIQGKAQVLLNDKSFVITAGHGFFVDVHDKHKVINISDTEDFVAIEVQYGSLVNENDIVRI